MKLWLVGGGSSIHPTHLTTSPGSSAVTIKVVGRGGVAPRTPLPAALGTRRPCASEAVSDPVRRAAYHDRRLRVPRPAVAIYVDDASIHLGEVLCRGQRIEHRLKGLDQPWTVLRLRRRDIDKEAQNTTANIRSLLE
jgi:hypothetical protein